MRVLVYEYLTAGGFGGGEAPESLRAEGDAMRRAIAGDFAAVPGVRVSTALAVGIIRESPPGIEVVEVEPGDSGSAARLSARFDRIALVAPETGGILAGLARSIEEAGGTSLGSSPGAIELTADKARLAAHFEARGILTPKTVAFETSLGLPTDWRGPAVIKPVDGAGALDTFVVPDPRVLPLAIRHFSPADLDPSVSPLPPGEGRKRGQDRPKKCRAASTASRMDKCWPNLI